MSRNAGMSPQGAAMAAPAARWLLFLALAFALAWFSNLGYRKLVKADEGRYAEISREMVATGDWLTPRLNDFKYFEKPALQYWATAAAFTAFGLHDWAARLWTGLTGALGLLLVYLIGNRAFGPPVGLAAAAVLASTVLWVFMGHFVTLDMGVSFFMAAAVFCCLRAQMDAPWDSATAAARRNWMLAGWAAMALAVLSKGLIGVVLPVAAMGAYIVLAWDWGRVKRLHIVSGLALFLLISAPWFIAVSVKNPEFFNFFFIHEHFERFTTTEHGRYEPAWYFIPILAMGAMPWLFSLIAGYANAWRAKPSDLGVTLEKGVKPFHAERFLALWCAVVFVFFSISNSKLPSYILPIFPALAVLIALQLRRASRTGLALQALFAALLGVAAIIAAPQLMTGRADSSLPAAMLVDYLPWVTAAGIALAVCAVLAAVAAWLARPLASVVLLAAGGLGFTQLALTGHESLSEVYSAYHVAQKIKPGLGPNTPVYSVNTFDHTLPYYLERTVIMVHYKDELEIAIGWEPHKFLPDMAAFEQRWARARDAYAVFAPADFAALPPALKAGMEVVARDPRRVAVKKKAS